VLAARTMNRWRRLQLWVALSSLGALSAGTALAEPGAKLTQSWTARQQHVGPGGQASGASRLTYSQHRLEITDSNRTVILELSSGAMTYIDPASKQWARVTLEELVKLRDAKLAELEARIESLPPQLQEQFESQLEAQRRADQRPPELVETEQWDEVNGYRCRIYRWSGPDGSGEACIAADLPIDLTAFRSDVERLGRRLVEVGASRTMVSMEFLRLSRDGFPVRTRQNIEMMPGQTVQATSTFSDFAPHEAAVLAPPAGYREVTFEALMRSVARPEPTRSGSTSP